MSEAFESYERQYCELSADLSEKAFSVSHLDGEQRNQKISEIKVGLGEAEALVRKMDLAARDLEPKLKAVFLAKLREYKSDLNILKSQAKQTVSTCLNQASRDELLEGGVANTFATSQKQRDRLLTSIEKLDNSSHRIGESKKIMQESEKIGVSLLQDLHQQRQSLLQADNALHGVDHNIGRSSRFIISMPRRMCLNKWIIGALVSLLLLIIALILYLKLSK